MLPIGTFMAHKLLSEKNEKFPSFIDAEQSTLNKEITIIIWENKFFVYFVESIEIKNYKHYQEWQKSVASAYFGSQTEYV